MDLLRSLYTAPGSQYARGRIKQGSNNTGLMIKQAATIQQDDIVTALPWRLMRLASALVWGLVCGPQDASYREKMHPGKALLCWINPMNLAAWDYCIRVKKVSGKCVSNMGSICTIVPWYWSRMMHYGRSLSGKCPWTWMDKLLHVLNSMRVVATCETTLSNDLELKTICILYFLINEFVN